ncbi:hypothetical protein ACFQ36_16990, partial [Arthrobacter sp. GCM10027362]|uniref:hypothetical protein n=1 Tax=Arthrobacter sp. GCM10027362 TaxID=3273379 RepID=UPI003631F020
ARLAALAGVFPAALATAAAAALCFSDGEQPSLTEHLAGIPARAAAEELDGLLTGITGLPDTDPLSVRIRREWSRLAGGQGGNLLLSLRRRLWAWSPNQESSMSAAAV